MTLKLVGAETEELDRESDEATLRAVRLAVSGCGLADIATDAERDIEWVIETLYAHRDLFRAEYPN